MKGSRDTKTFALRMPDEVKEAVRKSAEDEGRSINSEVVVRLEESLKKDGYLKEAA